MIQLNKKGFTLVELLAVIVILALLIVVVANTALPAMKGMQQNLLKTETKKILRNINQEIQTAKMLYHNDITQGIQADATTNSGITNVKVHTNSINGYYCYGYSALQSSNTKVPSTSNCTFTGTDINTNENGIKDTDPITRIHGKNWDVLSKTGTSTTKEGLLINLVSKPTLNKVNNLATYNYYFYSYGYYDYHTDKFRFINKVTTNSSNSTTFIADYPPTKKIFEISGKDGDYNYEILLYEDLSIIAYSVNYKNELAIMELGPNCIENLDKSTLKYRTGKYEKSLHFGKTTVGAIVDPADY